MRPNDIRHVSDDSIRNFFVAPFRQRPLPKLLTEHQTKTAASVDASIVPLKTGDMGLVLADNVIIFSIFFVCSANLIKASTQQVPTNSGEPATSSDYRRVGLGVV